MEEKKMQELTQEQMEAVSGGVDLRDNNKCPYCIGCWFRTRADLNKHMEQTHYVQCVFCQSYFPSRDELDKHVQEIHFK